MSTDSDLSPRAGDDLPATLLDRYWLGEAPPADVALVEAWYQRHPGQRDAHTAFRAGLKVRLPGETPDAWEQVESRYIAFALREGQPAKPTATRTLFAASSRRGAARGSRVRVMGIAAAAALLLCVSVAGVLAVRGRSAAPHTATPVPVAMTEARTLRGQRATLRLSDGSTVILGVASRIRYARDFGTTTRDIELEGEAYFDVVHDARVPFRVRTVHGVSEDIGTRFTVRAYAGEPATRVVVEEGRVGIGHGVTLAAGDLGRLRAGAAPEVRHDAPVHTLIAWTRGELKFVHTPLGDIVADLRRWYNVDVRIEDPALASRFVTVSFGKGTVGEALTSLAHGMGIIAERRADAWVLRSPARPAPE